MVVAVSFFLVLFLSLSGAVEMWKIHRPTESWLRIFAPTRTMVTRRRASQEEVRRRMHTQMLSCEDSAIRDAVFPVRSEEGARE
jgi:hypothetical protein